MSTSGSSSPFRVLSIDGGGVRGLYSAVLLHGIAQRVARMNGQKEERLDVGAAFNLIVGTSTGAILAASLCAGVTLERVINLYKTQARAIFQDPVPANGGQWALAQWIWRHRDAAANKPGALRSALLSILGEESVAAMYARRSIALCVPAVNIETQRAWVYKTPHDSRGNRLQRDNHYKLVDLCLSSAAAPIVFPIHGVATPHDAAGNVNWFVDGGLWANNPVMVALTEALSFAPDGAPIEVISVSTCPPFKAPIISEESANRGLLGWRGGIRMLEAAIDAQSSAYDYIATALATHLKERVTYVRLTDPKVNAEQVTHLRLDNPSKKCLDALVRLASDAIDLNMSEATTAARPKELITRVFARLATLPEGEGRV